MAIAATGAIGLGLLGAPAAHAGTPGNPAGTPPAKTAARTAEQQALVDARARAKATGQPVVIDALTTETSITTVKPDGSLTTTTNSEPVRTKRGKAWTQLDATLHRNADGSLSPAVSSNGLTLSGGGSGPLATITTADGKRLAVSAPFALPAPTLSGATATYTGVLPDVDLQVTATPGGAWRDVIVVHTAAAAANPQLKRLHFPIKADGLSVKADTEGNVTLKDGDGKVRFTAATPYQWDSTRPAPAAAGGKAPRALSAFAAPGAADAPSEETSTTERPGRGANVARIAVSAGDTALDLTPDPATFGQGTGPWYLDPYVSATGSTQAYAQVQAYHPTYTYTSGMSNLGLGYCDYSDCTGVGRERIYYQIGTPSQLLGTGAVIHDSTLLLQATSASAPSGPTVVNVYDSGSIGSGTTWNNQPCGTDSSPGSHCSLVASSQSFTGTGPINLDVTGIINTAVSHGWSNWTLLLAASNENDDRMRHHFSTNPTITTNYDIAPVIDTPRTSPTPSVASTGFTAPCENDPPAWIGAGQSVTLTANNRSPVGLPLLTSFNLWDNDDSTFAWNGTSGWAGGNNPNGVSVNVGSLSDGHQYGWNAKASDTDGSQWGLSSPYTSGCHFRIDRTAPTVSVASADFPPSGTTATPTKFNTDAGTFTVSGTDVLPVGGTRASGVACFRWSTNPTPVTNWRCSDAGVLAPDASGKATFNYTPGTWGTNTLYVQAQDNAGNYSQPSAYSFYAPWKPGSNPVFGDLTGDGKPDLMLTDDNGNLRLVQPTQDPTTAPNISGSAAVSPTGSWKNVQVTHRASLRGGVAVDDLLVHPATDKLMYLYQNDGHGNFNVRTSFYLNGSTTPGPITCTDADGAPVDAAQPGGCPTDLGTDWSHTSQILAIGTVEGENTATPGKTSLLAVINGKLWLFLPGTNNVRLLRRTGTEVSGANWDNVDLIGPGPANGDNQPTLWTRDRTSGVIHAYPLRKNADGSVDYRALADPNAGTVPGTGGVTPAAFPTVGSNGDLTGDGIADLWAVGSDGKLVVWSGTTSSGNATTPVNGFNYRTTLADFRAPLAHWRLNEAAASTTAADTTGLHPLTAQGGAAFGADTVNGKAATVAAFNGSTSALAAGGPVVADTTKSFTVSLWAKANASGGVVISQDGTNASGFQLWPSARSADVIEWRFGMAASDTAGATVDQTDTPNANARVTIGAWTQLTASYNATTGELLLYVNGALASTGLHKGTFNATGPTVLGRFKQNGAPAAFFNGSVAEVSVLPYATSPTTVSPTVIQSGTNPVKCLDDNNAGTANGNPVQVWDCYPGIAAQTWSLNADGTVTNQGKCLDANNGAQVNGTPVQLWDCAGNGNQQWLPTATGGLYNPASGRCLDDPDASTTNGARLQVWSCYDIPAQHWRFASFTPVPVAAQPTT
ncbi:hypothetical protein GCM10010441_70240 [Kitasatospora paracochleata]|uniref:Ricin-type beta-trefoil lectin protein n=1 Tax=Kitasatospora paracochleata TaxID=58354 RepID=A0ABT1J5B0_9ACTN|nr:ricin-type beta-trefoil lectin domain protein [Kitasatospora paracochleata]MCP2312298.1 hypothetical protein [Kitasatospora paracochleata]